jgi:ADP-heptose:LPS heptosyltransferase
MAAGAESLTLLAGPHGREVGELLPGVDDVLTWRSPWIDARPGPVDPDDVRDLVARLSARRFDAAVVLTSFHQSPLPTALLLRLAGVPRVCAISEDYPGSLLDVRHRVEGDPPEPERALSLARASGFDLPQGDDGRLAVRRPLPAVDDLDGLPEPPYVVVHPGTSVPARGWFADRWRATCELLAAQGLRVVVTGSPDETALTAEVAGRSAVDLGGRTSWAQLAAVLGGASVVAVGNTGAAHLAAAVGTPVVSLFAPTVPAARWAPYGVATVLLGDQHAVCRDTRVIDCPFEGHPCMAAVTPQDVLDAVASLVDVRGPALVTGGAA